MYLDKKNDITQEEIIKDLSRRINNLTGYIEEEHIDDELIFKTRDMPFAAIKAVDDYVEIKFELPYDRILDMNGKCEVQPYASKENVDIVTYKIRTKFDIQYAVSIAQQSFIYRKRLKL